MSALPKLSFRLRATSSTLALKRLSPVSDNDLQRAGAHLISKARIGPMKTIALTTLA